MTRIVAANRVIDADGDEMKPGVVELEGKYVSSVYPLFGERPFTEVARSISSALPTEGSKPIRMER